MFPGINVNGEKIVGTRRAYDDFHPPVHFLVLSTFRSLFPAAFLRMNVMPRRIHSFPDFFNFWNSLSSIGSGITFLSFGFRGPALG